MVCFVPFKNGEPSGPWEIFADGFVGKDTILSYSQAASRPMGLAMGLDGSLYITDSEKVKSGESYLKGTRNSLEANS